MTEHEQIKAGLQELFSHSPIGIKNQFGRVVAVAAGSEWLTLRQMEKRISDRFPDKDTPAAISARLRQVSPILHGLIKQRRMEYRHGKRVYRYRLIPAPNIVTCPRCEKRYRDFTDESEFIGWHGECPECALTKGADDE